MTKKPCDYWPEKPKGDGGTPEPVGIRVLNTVGMAVFLLFFGVPLLLIAFNGKPQKKFLCDGPADTRINCVSPDEYRRLNDHSDPLHGD